MASLIEELVEVLTEECSIYEKLLAVSDEKTRVIVRSDLEELQNITEQEQQVVEVVLALEKRRQGIVVNIATVLNQNPKTMTVADIIRVMGKQPEIQDKLSRLHRELKRVVEQLQQKNNHNRELLENSLEMAEFSIRLLQSATQAPETANYGAGLNHKMAYSGDTLGASRIAFDTKQ